MFGTMDRALPGCPNLHLIWLRDKSLEDSEDLPDPDVLAQEIADDLQTALDQFAGIAGELKE